MDYELSKCWKIWITFILTKFQGTEILLSKLLIKSMHDTRALFQSYK
jgi:hypothetical protein